MFKEIESKLLGKISETKDDEYLKYGENGFFDDINKIITLREEGDSFGRTKYLAEKGVLIKLIPMTKIGFMEFVSSPEFKKLSEVKHDHLIKVDQFFHYTDQFNTSYIVLVTKHRKATSLAYYLNKDNLLSQNKLLEYLSQIFSALEYLHENEITHFDIKPDNIIIHEDKAYLSDYWLSTVLTPTTIASKGISMKSNSKYISPEVWKAFIQSNMSDEVYKLLYKVDVYSTVLSFYEVFSKNNVEIGGKKMAFEKIFDYEKIFPKTDIDWFDRLTLKSVTQTYQERATSKEIKSFLEDIKSTHYEKIKSVDNSLEIEYENFIKEKLIEEKKEKIKNDVTYEIDKRKMEERIDQTNGLNSEIYEKKIKMPERKPKFEERSDKETSTLSKKKQFEEKIRAEKAEKELKEKIERQEQFLETSKIFNLYYSSQQVTDKSLVVLIGKKLPKEYKNVRVIDFDKGTTSSLEDMPVIEAFVESFPKIRFILLNIDDFNITVKVSKAFSYLTKLVASNKSKNFLVFTYWSLNYSETLVKFVQEQLDFCKNYDNMIYISSAGNQGINYKKNQGNNTNYRFPVSFKHPSKISIGSLDKDFKLSNSTNRGHFVDYYAYGADSSTKASCHVLLLTLLLWSFHDTESSQKIIKRIEEHSILKKDSEYKLLDFVHSVKKLEKEFLREKFLVKTKLEDEDDIDETRYLTQLDLSFELFLNKEVNGSLYAHENDIFPTSIRLEFDIKDDSYDIKFINEKIKENVYSQRVELRKSIDGKKTKIDESEFKYDPESAYTSFNVSFSNNNIKLKIGKYSISFNNNFDTDINKLHKITVRKTDKYTNFQNFAINHTTENKNSIMADYEDSDVTIDYDHSIAVFFIVNIFKQNSYIGFYNNLFKFIQMVIKKGFKVYILSGVHASYVNLLRLFTMIKKVNERATSRLLFYYFGHTKYVNDDNLLDNYSLTAYTEENDDENLIAYQQLINDIRKLNFMHKWTILESCHSGKLIEKKMTDFSIDTEKIKDKVHYIITAKNEISSKGDLVKRIMDSIKYNNCPLNLLFNDIMNFSKNMEYDDVKPIMRKEGEGNFYFSNSKERYDQVVGNFNDLSVEKFDENKFEQWLVNKI